MLEHPAAILRRDPVRNANILCFMRDYPVTDVAVVGESVMVKGRSDRDWVYISSASEGEFRDLVGRLHSSDTCFAIMEDWMLPIITRGRQVLWQLSCMRLHLPGEATAPELSGPVEELTPGDAAFIFRHYEYAEYTTEEFIADRIARGPSFGIREGGRLAAWIMTQDDGAMGFLTVLPEHRRKGYAARLTAAMIHRLRQTGDLPFVHIEESNEKSMGLALKTGFVPDRRVHWLEVKGIG